MPYVHLTNEQVALFRDIVDRALVTTTLDNTDVAQINEVVAQLNPTVAVVERHAEIRHLARRIAERQGHEIDDDAIVSEGEDNGAYVMAWVWVSFEGTDLDKEI